MADVLCETEISRIASFPWHQAATTPVAMRFFFGSLFLKMNEGTPGGCKTPVSFCFATQLCLAEKTDETVNLMSSCFFT